MLLCVAPFAAMAIEPANVKLSGHLDTTIANVKESNHYRTDNPNNPNGANKYNRTAIVNETKILINIDGKYRDGITYGGLIKLHADASQAANSETTVGDKAMVYVQSDKIGRLEAGNYFGVAAAFEGSVPLIETGTGGVDGQWVTWPSSSTKKLPTFPPVSGSQFITNPNLPSYISGEYYSDAPKVTFYTKPVTGLTVGISYTPDLDAAGTASNIGFKKLGPKDSRVTNGIIRPGTFKNVFTAGGSYKYNFAKDFAVTGALTGEVGKSKIDKLRDLKAYEASLAINWKNTKLTSSYGNAFKTWTYKDKVAGSKQLAKYWTVSLGHQLDKFGMAVAYMQSKKAGGLESFRYASNAAAAPDALVKAGFADFRANKLDVVTFDMDYKLVQGFLPYAGVAGFKFREGQGPKDKGYVLMAGTKLTF